MAATGFVFDGFPRTMPQAESLQTIWQRHRTPLDLAIWLDVSEETVSDRIAQSPAMPGLRIYHQRDERGLRGAARLPLLRRPA